MTDTFKNSSLDVTTTLQSAYTCPAATQAAVHTVNLSNVTNAIITVNVEVVDASGSVNRVLFQDLPISPGGAFVFPKTINLEPSDQIQISASANTSCEAFLSIIERTV